MLDRLQKNSQSALLVILAVTLAVLFGTQFGPRQGCSSEDFKGVPYIAKVYGRTIAQQDFQSVARIVRLNDNRTGPMRRAIVDGLIERELLAHEGERMGLRVTEAELNDEIRGGYYFVSLGSQQLPQLMGYGRVESSRRFAIYSNDESRNPNDPPPAFRLEDFERWVAGVYSRTITDYKNFMARELLAERVRTIVTSSVRPSVDEVWRDYERNHTQVSVRYLRFSPDFYRLTVRDDDPTLVQAFAASHQDEINRQWEQRRESLRDLPAQVRLRHILLRFPDDAQDPAKLAIRQRADEIRRRIATGAEPWIRMARLYSQDSEHWKDGGETSWVTADRVDLPDDVKRALTALSPGQMSEVIQSPLGVHIVQLVGRRQGTVTEADGKAEIARELFRLTRGNELANEAATGGQRRLGEAGATLDTVSAALAQEALEAFYRGPVPAAETLAGDNPLAPETRTDVGAPEVRETQPFTQNASFPGVSSGDALVSASFALTAERPSPAAPITVGDERFILRLKDGGLQRASRTDFDGERIRLMDEFVSARRREAILQFIARLRARAERDQQLRMGTSPLLQEPRRESAEGATSGGAAPSAPAARPSAPAPAPAPAPAN
ncbi:MAG: peptidylprolyl isomerase [Deltaproteobacteria bacterium]|nr:peptidylprolyl isomerase [Deltaproteobacteria bacterium]